MTDKISMRQCAMAVVAVAGFASIAAADISYEVFTIRASNMDGQIGAHVVTLDDGYFDSDGTFHWEQGEDIDIMSNGGVYLGTLFGSTITIVEDPIISLNFNVQASDQNTIFQIDSGILSFPQIAGPIGSASAGVSITDLNGNGATITPDGNSMYLASYDKGLGTAGDFAALLAGTVTAGAFGSNSASEAFPGGGGYVALGQPIENMVAEWKFTVSARDVASGTSIYTVIPAPAGLALLGVAGLVGVRRRR